MAERARPSWLPQSLDWRTPSDTLRHACADLIQSAGWRAVLAAVADEVQRQHTVASNLGATERITWDALGRQNALLELVERVYRVVSEPSPFVQTRVAWLAQWTRDMQPQSQEGAPDAKPEDAAGFMPRRSSGGVL